jgi:rubrerythrin
MTTTIQEPPVGASVWEARLHQMLTGHVQRERGLLEAYAAAAESTSSEALRYLVGLLIDDEKRHHRVFLELAASLKNEAELSADDPVVPRLDFSRANAEAVLEVSQDLLQNEHDDLHELKELKRALRDVEDTTLWSLLIDLMMRDTEKHIAILKFAEKQARRRSH